MQTFEVNGVELSSADFPHDITGWLACNLALLSRLPRCNKRLMVSLLVDDAKKIIKQINDLGGGRSNDSGIVWITSREGDGGSAHVRGFFGNRGQAIAACETPLDFVSFHLFGEDFKTDAARYYPLAEAVKPVQQAAEEPEAASERKPVARKYERSTFRSDPLLDEAMRYVRSNRLPKNGYVVLNHGVAFGWDRELCDPHKVEPGVVAFCCESGRKFKAIGGSKMHGAEDWVLEELRLLSKGGDA